jgi:hypothetical protein
MNKRLLLALYDRSGLGAYMPVDYKGQKLEVEEHWEKFAELIVRECIDIAQDYANFPGYPPNDVNDIIDEIKQHFGVEL